MEQMEFISAGIDSVLQILELLGKQPRLPLPVKDRILNHHLDLRFRKCFSRSIIKCAAEAGQNARLYSIFKVLCERTSEEEWVNLASDMLQTPKSLKTIISNLWGDLTELSSLDGLINHLINQIRAVEEKLCFIGKLFEFSAKRCSDQHDKLEEFLSFMEAVMNYAAGLSFFHGIHNPMFRIFRSLLSLNSPVPSEKFEMSELVMSLCDLLLEDFVSPVKDRFQVFFRDGLMFLTTFLMYPPEEPEREAGDVLLRRMVDIISDLASSICASYRDDAEIYIQSVSEDMLLVLQVEIHKVMAEITEIYVPIPNFSGSNFPQTNDIGFIDRLLGNLEEIMKSKGSSIPFATEKILYIQEDLLSIKAFLNDQQEVTDLRRRIINAAYHAEHVVESCFVEDTPIWYDMLSLSKVTEELKVIKREVQKIIDLEMCKVRKPNDGYHSGYRLPSRRANNTSKFEQVFVGFKDEMQAITDRLTRGTMQLDIISIVGMPGQGKTTLAKKVYNDPSVKYHFHKCAWCCVSQVYEMKELLLDILSDVTGYDIRSSSPRACQDELAERLRKSLKGRKFLIVLDDIWDIGAWDDIKRSFPDDGIGSRIIFTSRIHKLVSQAKRNCNPHSIRLLDDEESWELLQKRLFDDHGCPSELSGIGKKIATKCKGLPLAIVLVAGILARKDKNLDCWKEMMGAMDSHIADEGCRDLVELSYKHLPEGLKPCFLYFGAFPEDNIIRVKKLIQLWTAEGFIQRNDAKSLDDIAGEYLMDLIDRSLVIVAARSSKGGVKACHVHDVLYDFCLTKAREEGFLHKLHVSDVSDDFPKTYDEYRLCTDNVYKLEQFINSRPAGSYVHSLVLSHTNRIWCESTRLGPFLLGFKFLHVLHLLGIHIIDGIFPEEITLLVHLRYLAISAGISHLPSSIANLWNLETLSIVRSFVIPLPDAIWAVKTLRYIYMAAMVTFKDYNNSDHESCQLHNVVTVSEVIIASWKDIKELSRRLPRLQKLKFLWDLPLDWRDPIQFSVFTFFSQLKSLAIYKRNQRCDNFPYLDLPKTLRKITLIYFGLDRGAISIIGKLPNLQVLKLQQVAFVDKRWDLEDGEFLNLKFLLLSGVELRHWVEVDCNDPFPKLESLVLRHCDYLEEIPPSFGVIPTLKRMDIVCRRKNNALISSAKQIAEEQKELGNADLEFSYIQLDPR